MVSKLYQKGLLVCFCRVVEKITGFGAQEYRRSNRLLTRRAMMCMHTALDTLVPGLQDKCFCKRAYEMLHLREWESEAVNKNPQRLNDCSV